MNHTVKTVEKNDEVADIYSSVDVVGRCAAEGGGGVAVAMATFYQILPIVRA